MNNPQETSGTPQNPGMARDMDHPKGPIHLRTRAEIEADLATRNVSSSKGIFRGLGEKIAKLLGKS